MTEPDKDVPTINSWDVHQHKGYVDAAVQLGAVVYNHQWDLPVKVVDTLGTIEDETSKYIEVSSRLNGMTPAAFEIMGALALLADFGLVPKQVEK